MSQNGEDPGLNKQSKKLPKPKYTPNLYYKLISNIDLKNGKPPVEEKSLAYYYYNPDANCYGFGWNVADGGGFLPEWDIKKGTRIVTMELVEKVASDIAG